MSCPRGTQAYGAATIGWTYDIDGRCLETPGGPAHSQLRGTIVQGAYPVREVDKLIFAYMGPPDEQPEMRLFGILRLSPIVRLSRFRSYFA